MTNEILYRADVFSSSGYARASRANIRALVEGGVKVKLQPVRHDTIHVNHDLFWKEHIPKLLHNDLRPKVRVTQQTPDLIVHDPQYREIAFTVFETSRIPSWDVGGSIRGNWVKQLNKCERVWTASEFCKKVFEDSGVSVPIHVFPHPIDIDMYCPGEKRPMLDGKNKVNSDSMVFLSVFQWNKRKDPTSLLLAWWAEFGNNPEVQLVIKSYTTDFVNNQVIVQSIKKLKQDCQVRESCGNVHLLLSQVDESRMPDLYRSADVLVSTTRGEGFGLPMQEAQACGIPCIYPDATSLSEFCVGYPVEVFREPAHGVGTPWYTIDSEWWTVQTDSLRRQMRKAYEDWKEAGKRMPDGMREEARAAVEGHSYPAMAKKFKEHLETI